MSFFDIASSLTHIANKIGVLTVIEFPFKDLREVEKYSII